MSYVYLSRHTEEEYQRYTPNENRRVESIGKLGRFFFFTFVGGIVLVIGLAYVGFSGDEIIPWVGYVFPWVVGSVVFLLVIAGIAGVAYQGKLAELDYLVDNALLKERDALHTQVAKMEDDIKSVADRVRDIKATG